MCFWSLRHEKQISSAVTYHLDGTLGALQIGAMISSMLYGVTMIQTYIYFHRGNTDSALSKSVIGFIWILDTLHQIFICHVTYTYTVTRYGDITPLQQQTWSMIHDRLSSLSLLLWILASEACFAYGSGASVERISYCLLSSPSCLSAHSEPCLQLLSKMFSSCTYNLMSYPPYRRLSIAMSSPLLAPTHFWQSRR